MPTLSKRQRAVVAYDRQRGREPSAGWSGRQARQNDIDRRVQKLFAEDNRKREAEIERRMRKLGLLAVDPLDAEIQARIAKQPRDYHRTLNMLFGAWAGFAELYFGGKLKLPVLSIATLQNAQADCCTRQTPTEIRFAPKTIATHSREALCDILLHEMIHQAIGERDGAHAAWGGAEWMGHHAEFRRIANRIGRLRGWPDCSEHVLCHSTAAQFWPPRTHH